MKKSENCGVERRAETLPGGLLRRAISAEPTAIVREPEIADK
jgi:hypothetical protein